MQTSFRMIIRDQKTAFMGDMSSICLDCSAYELRCVSIALCFERMINVKPNFKYFYFPVVQKNFGSETLGLGILGNFASETESGFIEELDVNSERSAIGITVEILPNTYSDAFYDRMLSFFVIDYVAMLNSGFTQHVMLTDETLADYRVIPTDNHIHNKVLLRTYTLTYAGQDYTLKFYLHHTTTDEDETAPIRARFQKMMDDVGWKSALSSRFIVPVNNVGTKPADADTPVIDPKYLKYVMIGGLALVVFMLFRANR